MIRRSGELKTTEKSDLYEGKGAIQFQHMMEAEKGEFYDKGRLFSILTIKPGDSIGYHVHNNEMECYYVLEGEAEYSDSSGITTIKKGDTTVTLNGEGHSVVNKSSLDFVFVALVLFA